MSNAHPVRVKTADGWQELALTGPQGPPGPQGNPGAGASDATSSSKGSVQLAGDLAGTAASPQIATGVIVNADVNAGAAIAESKLNLASDAAAGTASRRTLGTGAQQAAAGSSLALKVDVDAVVTAAVRVMQNKLLAGDANPTFRIMGDGHIDWGQGGATAPDTNLFRAGAGDLVTDGYFTARSGLYALAPSLTDVAVGAYFAGDTNDRWEAWANGSLHWGPGGATAPDTNLYRVSANILKTDSFLVVGGEVRGQNYVWANYGAAEQVLIGYASGTNPGITFGGAGDTTLNRAATGVLKLNGSFADAAYGTTLPASPVDGQQYTLVDSLTNPTYQWRFRYNAGSSSAYKWEFVGGTTAYAEVNVGEATASLSYVALTTAGPSIALPRPGDYEVEIGFGGWTNGAANGLVMSYDIGGTAASDNDKIDPVSTAANYLVYASRARRKTGLTAVTLIAKYKVTVATNATFGSRWMRVTPVRVS